MERKAKSSLPTSPFCDMAKWKEVDCALYPRSVLALLPSLPLDKRLWLLLTPIPSLVRGAFRDTSTARPFRRDYRPGVGELPLVPGKCCSAFAYAGGCARRLLVMCSVRSTTGIWFLLPACLLGTVRLYEKQNENWHCLKNHPQRWHLFWRNK